MSKIAIIGAGMGGLVAGNLLAKRGHEVTLFESHSMPGGYTAGFRRKGFYFESGTLSFESSPVVFSVMKELGVYDKIPFTRQYSRFLTNTFDCSLYKIDDWRKALYAAYPSEKANLDEYWVEVDKMLELFRALGKSRNFFQRIISFPKMASFMRMYRKYERMTITEFTERYFDENSELFFLLKEMGYPDMSASIVAAALIAFIDDYWTVKTGMQSWADVLAENYKNLGGELKLKSMVEKIITKDGTAVGVVCNGKEYPADYVLSAGDYKKTFLKLLDDKSLLPEGFEKKVQDAAVSEGFFTVYLGLNLPGEKLREHMKLPHVMYYDLKVGYDLYDSNDKDFFEKCSLWLYSTSMFDEGNAPAGKSSLMIQSPVPLHWMNNWGDGDREEYKRLKNKAMKTLIQRASAVIPNLEKYIEFQDAATPLTYERYTHNTDGATSAWSWNPKKWFYKDGYNIRVTTPVKNLLICSCWAHQMGGIPTAVQAPQKCAELIR
jgi:phytoene dehydrogenase-like protein